MIFALSVIFMFYQLSLCRWSFLGFLTRILYPYVINPSKMKTQRGHTINLLYYHALILLSFKGSTV